MQTFYKFLPAFVQNILITLYNIKEYRKRYGGKYWHYRKIFHANRNLSIEELNQIQKERFAEFVAKAINSSPFYAELYRGLNNVTDISNIPSLPVVDKEIFRKYSNSVYTIDKTKAIKSKTGGTTGKSLEVFFTYDNMQERFAMLDDFRSRFGYQLGKKTAWFSGKALLTERDIRKNKFWKTDFYHKVRYYSTFHIKADFLKYYIDDLIAFKPEYIVGFPSSVMEIAKYGLQKGIDFPKGIVKAVFPTAETVTCETRAVIQQFFKAEVYDQYASSEGAPFIFECKNHKLHIELQSGVFEVLDDDFKRVDKGKLVVTSFTTEGTPLIRYDIGDSVELSKEICNCGNNNPVVKQILGRIDDFIYSPENGKINLGNVSNTLKDTKGITKFQVLQNELNKIIIQLLVDKEVYDKAVETKFLRNWIDRVGDKMAIELRIVDDIPNEKSGKFRMVKNTIKHLIE